MIEEINNNFKWYVEWKVYHDKLKELSKEEQLKQKYSVDYAWCQYHSFLFKFEELVVNNLYQSKIKIVEIGA